MVPRLVQRVYNWRSGIRHPAAIVAAVGAARRLRNRSPVIRLRWRMGNQRGAGRLAAVADWLIEPRAAGPGAHCPRAAWLTGGIYPGGRYAESPAPASPSRELIGICFRCGRAIPPGRGHVRASLPGCFRAIMPFSSMTMTPRSLNGVKRGGYRSQWPLRHFRLSQAERVRCRVRPGAALPPAR